MTSHKKAAMPETEAQYIRKVEELIDHFAYVQREFVLARSGVHAIIDFIEDFQEKSPSFSLEDPVMLKGKTAALKVIKEFDREVRELGNISAPEVWKQFHESLTESLRKQLQGYREMVKVFEDNDLDHISVGQKIVEEGMGILEGGNRRNSKDDNDR